MSATLRDATAADIARAARTLAEAFDTYPWTRWSIPADGYATRLERVQAAYLSHALAHGIVLVTDDVAGVIALLPPDTPDPDEETQETVGALLGDRVQALLRVELPARPQEAWDLATLGVAPNRAGRGIGSALIAAALARTASSRTPAVSLETSDPRNVALYERHGFTTTAVTQVPDGPIVYSMATGAAAR